MTAAFIPRVVKGYLNTNYEKSKDRQFVENILKINSDNMIIIKNSRIQDLLQKVTGNKSPIMRNILKALYLSKVICSMEDRLGKIKQFRMQELEIYIEFEHPFARSAIERLLFLQNYHTRDRQTVKLFTLHGGEYSELVDDGNFKNPSNDWDSNKLLLRIQKILKKSKDSATNPDKKIDSKCEWGQKSSKNRYQDENLVYLTSRLVEGLQQKEDLIRQVGRAVLKDLSHIIECFSSFHYLNDLTYEDVIDKNETLFDFVSVNRNLKSDKALRRISLVMENVRENSVKKYYARGITRLPLYPSIFEIFILIFEKNANLIVSSDWAKNFELENANDPVSTMQGGEKNRAQNSQITFNVSQKESILKEVDSDKSQNSDKIVVNLNLKWVEKMLNSTRFDWNKMKYTFPYFSEIPRPMNYNMAHLAYVLNIVKSLSTTPPKSYQLLIPENPKQEPKKEPISHTINFSQQSALKLEDAHLKNPNESGIELLNKGSELEIPDSIIHLLNLRKKKETFYHKIISDSKKMEGNQSILSKGLIHDLEYLFFEEDIERILNLSHIVNSNLEEFSPLVDWKVFRDELVNLLKKPRFPNFYNDRWVESFWHAKGSKRKRERVKAEYWKEGEEDAGVDFEESFGEELNVERHSLDFLFDGKSIGKWTFWGVDHAAKNDYTKK